MYIYICIYCGYIDISIYIYISTWFIYMYIYIYIYEYGHRPPRNPQRMYIQGFMYIHLQISQNFRAAPVPNKSPRGKTGQKMIKSPFKYEYLKSNRLIEAAQLWYIYIYSITQRLRSSSCEQQVQRWWKQSWILTQSTTSVLFIWYYIILYFSFLFYSITLYLYDTILFCITVYLYTFTG